MTVAPSRDAELDEGHAEDECPDAEHGELGASRHVTRVELEDERAEPAEQADRRAHAEQHEREDDHAEHEEQIVVQRLDGEPHEEDGRGDDDDSLCGEETERDPKPRCSHDPHDRLRRAPDAAQPADDQCGSDVEDGLHLGLNGAISPVVEVRLELVPEGDTIHRTAAGLDRVLAGKELVRFEAPRLTFTPFAPGVIIEGAAARGKHCLVHFDDGRTLRTHMRMTGSWHLYRPGERWRKKPAAMRALVTVDDWVAVCFAAPEVDLVVVDDAAVHTGHLGPDLCLADADVERAAQLLVELSEPEREIGDALLDQRIACGVGNVWKSETLFVERVDPFTPLCALTDEQRRALLGTASHLLREQVTRPTQERFVYGRRGRPCRVCATPIAWRPQGRHRRGTYWCPTCQAG